MFVFSGRPLWRGGGPVWRRGGGRPPKPRQDLHFYSRALTIKDINTDHKHNRSTSNSQKNTIILSHMHVFWWRPAWRRGRGGRAIRKPETSDIQLFLWVSTPRHRLSETNEIPRPRNRKATRPQGNKPRRLNDPQLKGECSFGSAGCAEHSN